MVEEVWGLRRGIGLRARMGKEKEEEGRREQKREEEEEE